MILAIDIAPAATSFSLYEISLYVITVTMLLWLLYRQEQKYLKIKMECCLKVKRYNSQLDIAMLLNNERNTMMSKELTIINKSFHTFIEHEEQSLDKLELSKQAITCAAIMDTYSRVWKQL